MRVLITGAAGQDGTILATQLGEITTMIRKLPRFRRPYVDDRSFTLNAPSTH